MEKYKPCLRSTNVTCPGALERSCSRALFLIVVIANTAFIQYTYDKGNLSSVQRTTRMASVTSGGQRYGYTYDSMGNIATFSAPGKGTVTYTYDNQGQLLSAVGDTTYTYTYDGAGNILTANGHTYTYGDATWKDLLTAFDGNSITYDAIGNPTSYYNGTRWTMSWTNGRSLATASDGTNSLSFAYDAGGLRTSKTVNGTTYRYYYASGKLMRMSWGANILDFFYNANGAPYAMKYNGTAYYYITNLQGDVMHIVNASGTVMASYDYDPYGKVISATGTLAGVNPLRYRGYVYDQETGFYYLQSRYYDPVVGRFINADVLVSAGRLNLICNMFAYCHNNPANYLDTNGFDAIWIQEGDSAAGCGHSGLMAQDEDGEWFYFFWGPSNENSGLEILLGTTHPTDYPHIPVNGEDLTNTKQVIQVLARSNSSASDRANLITSTRYFEGDYVKTYEKAKDILTSSAQYKLLTNNCVQNTLTAFAESDWRFILVAHGLENSLIPNRTAERVALLPKEQGAFPLKLLLLDLLT